MYRTRKYYGKLNKRQTEEIGTLKSPTKPLYIAKENIENLTQKKKELKAFENIKYEAEEEIKKYKKEIKEEEEILKMLMDMELISQEEKLEKERIEIRRKGKKRTRKK